MRNVLRFFSPGNTYFLTHVTYKRRPILIDSVGLLRDAIEKYNQQNRFHLIAWVILPDHWHLVIDPKRNDISKLMKCIKLSFAYHYRKSKGIRSGRIWHNRFWDHMIRDQNDMSRHLDYVHYNPVRHGLTQAPIDYEFSSFRTFVDKGMYQASWGSSKVVDLKGEFGEKPISQKCRNH